MPQFGRLGATAAASGSNTLLYQVSSGSVATVTITVCNQNSTGVDFNLALSPSGSSEPVVADYLEYRHELLGYDAMEKSGVVLGQEDQLYVWSSNVSCSFVAHGIQEEV
jgi:hypothetical protein